MDSTIEYYEEHAVEFIAETQKLKMDAFYEMFEKYIRPGNMILDLGSGSGRDSKYFHDRGYEVVAIDPSLAMCSATKKYEGVEVINCKANEIEWVDYFDGIWASASLLHVPYAEMKATLYTVMRALKPNGIMYFSVKKGQTQRLDEGRLYTDYSENSITELLTGLDIVQIEHIWESNDVRNQDKKWINVLVKRKKNDK